MCVLNGAEADVLGLTRCWVAAGLLWPVLKAWTLSCCQLIVETLTHNEQSTDNWQQFSLIIYFFHALCSLSPL